ncbi:MAG: hypothetical protein ABIP71_15875 [Verrucomicrobiota bacterium]
MAREIYPVWGTDHYFRPESLARGLITAVLQYLADEIGFKRAENLGTKEPAFS